MPKRPLTLKQREALYSGRRWQDKQYRVMIKQERKRNEVRRFRSSQRWTRMREWYIKRHPTCVNPRGIHDEVRPAVDIHHIVPLIEDMSKGLDADNLMSLCRECHAIVERKGLG